MTGTWSAVVDSAITKTGRDDMTTEPTAQDPATGLTREDLRRAALTVCGYATDVDDAREMLEALGLLDDLRSDAIAS
jgi:hypothetical protein